MQGINNTNNFSNYYNPNYGSITPASNTNNPIKALQPPQHMLNPNLATGSQHIKNYIQSQIRSSKASINNALLHTNDPTIKEAINKIKEINFSAEDMNYMKKLGVNIIYKNGREALNTILERNLKIEFGKVVDPQVHAQFDNKKNLVTINKKYKGTKDPAVILAISEALIHELGHAKDKDSQSSIQEEIDCLALNTLAHRYHQKKYPQIFTSANSNADIINEGVCLYTKLFYDPDPKKEALAKRLMEKYGNLPLESPNHKMPLKKS